MKFTEKLAARQNNLMGEPPVTVAFLGDSVTQGCFELITLPNGAIDTIFETGSSYSADLQKIFQTLYPHVQFNVINTGISGDNAPHGYSRLKRDILDKNPDLVIVMFGLNDSGRGYDGLEEYKNALASIFKDIKEQGIDVIFMTPNMMCTYVSYRMTTDLMKQIGAGCANVQNSGIMDAYMDGAREVAAKYDVPVCDVYAKWKKLNAAGCDTTDLLANGVNHPSRSLHWLFAYSLAETIFSL